jgi:hypothetical protein
MDPNNLIFFAPAPGLVLMSSQQVCDLEVLGRRHRNLQLVTAQPTTRPSCVSTHVNNLPASTVCSTSQHSLALDH